ncbi:hypothetical protein FRC15_006453 [Serendipita sp. 397]|nr:hypothetical protein FRC15_006453 [Serendipita sp. 397]
MCFSSCLLKQPSDHFYEPSLEERPVLLTDFDPAEGKDPDIPISPMFVRFERERLHLWPVWCVMVCTSQQEVQCLPYQSSTQTFSALLHQAAPKQTEDPSAVDKGIGDAVRFSLRVDIDDKNFTGTYAKNGWPCRALKKQSYKREETLFSQYL